MNWTPWTSIFADPLDTHRIEAEVELLTTHPRSAVKAACLGARGPQAVCHFCPRFRLFFCG